MNPLIVRFLGLPIVYLLGMALLFFTGRRKGLGSSLGSFALCLAAGVWAITRSRASTAAIGFLFLPYTAMLVGLLGLAFGYGRSAKYLGARIAGWASLAIAALIIGSLLMSGKESIQLNTARQTEAEAWHTTMDSARATVQTLLLGNKGRETEVLSAQTLEQRRKSPAFVLAAVETPYLSPDVLDSLVTTTDISLTPAVVRNPNTRPATLERVFRTHHMQWYFHQDLAANPHTPPTILRAIYETRPPRINNLPYWLADNPATPKDILGQIADTTTDRNVLNAFLRNPALDCPLVKKIEVRDRAPVIHSPLELGPLIQEKKAEVCR